MGMFKYLGAIIPVAFAEYILVIIIVLLYYKKHASTSETISSDLSLFEKFFYGKNFSFTYKGSFSTKYDSSSIKLSTWILLFTRCMFFSYFVGIGFLYNYIHAGGDIAYFFTLWNIDLIAVYYTFVLIASIIGVYYDSNISQEGSDETNWSPKMQNFGYIIQILFEVAGGSALFITIVAFTLLDPYFHFWNVTDHFLTSCSLIVELFLNSMHVRWEHMVFNISWAMTYLIFIWPLIATRTRNEWPYNFLKLNSSACFIWYTMLLVVNIVFYMLFYMLSYIKSRYIFPSLFQYSPSHHMVASKIHHDQEDEV